MRHPIRSRALLFGAILSTTGLASSQVRDSTADDRLDFRPLQAIAKFHDKEGATREFGNRLLREIGPQTFVVASAASEEERTDLAAATWTLIEELRARDDVEFAHPNYRMQFAQVTPNDPLFPLQWNLQAVRAPQAWSMTTGSAQTLIAIVDGGRSSHPELNFRWAHAASTAPPYSDVGEYVWWPHSTHVASIAGAESNNGLGTAGVCWNCSLMSVKVIDSFGDIDISYVTAGINYAVAQGARVINLSLAWPQPCSSVQALAAATQSAYEQGIHVIAAAGNFGGSAANVIPASCPGVIAVAATDSNDNLAVYSGRGGPVFLSAPGGGGVLDHPPYSGYGAGINCPSDPDSFFNPYTVGVPGAWTTTPNGGSAHCYRYLSGTSMSAPHVSGAIGLMLSVNPQLLAAQVRNALTRSAQALPACGNDCGAGLLDIEAAVGMAANPGMISPAHIRALDKQSKEWTTMLRSLDRSTNYQTFNAQHSTGLFATGTDSRWVFLLGDYNGDGIADLYAIDRLNPPGTTVVVYDGADGYQSFLVYQITALHTTGSDGSWSFVLGDYNNDGVVDLYAINKQGASGKTEIHILNGANQFQSFLLHTATALHPTGSDHQWVFLAGDYNGNGTTDVYAINRMNASGTTLHVLNGADNFQTFLTHRVTGLHQSGTDGQWNFGLGDFNGDGILDLFTMNKEGSSGAVQVHVLGGANQFQHFIEHRVTALKPAGTDHRWVLLVETPQ